MNSLISIIVPNYNHEKFLKQRLDSVFNQTFQNFEVILMDDCSTDESVQLLQTYANHPKVSHFIVNEKNSGNTFIQWNKGIALAKGEYIWIAETDDFCELNFLELLLKQMVQGSDITLAYCQSNKVNEKNEITGNWIDYTNDLDLEFFINDFTLDGNLFIERFLIYKNVIPNASAILIKRSRALEIGYLDINPLLKYNADWLFYINIITNKKIGFVPDSLNNFRHHSQSVIATAGKNETILELKNIILETRKKINNIFKREYPSNVVALLKLNNDELKKIIYHKADYYIRNHQKLKGYFLILGVFDFFLIKKRIFNKIKTKLKSTIKFIFEVII